LFLKQKTSTGHFKNERCRQNIKKSKRCRQNIKKSKRCRQNIKKVKDIDGTNRREQSGREG